MNFYSSIACYYDRIFPFSPNQLAFVTSRLPSPNENRAPSDRRQNSSSVPAVLDIGCATGSLDLALYHNGYSVTGIDNDEEMIVRAREKLDTVFPDSQQAPRPEFTTMDMRTIHDAFGDSKFQGVICFGNTLVHLREPAEIQHQIYSFARVLEEKGKLFLQIINYDYILNYHIDRLPTIENEDIRFERRYRKDTAFEYLHFDTVLTDKKSGKKIKNSVPLYPLGKDELHTYLVQENFTSIHYLGGFDSSPLSEKDLPLIVTAEKQPHLK